MSEPMKAIVVRQPWATLIALGIKTIETRPGPPNGPMRPAGVRGLPGRTLERGERIAIVAAKAVPVTTQWEDGPFDDIADRYQYGGSGEPGQTGWWLADLNPRLHVSEQETDLPLGAVVCTVVVADALPIVPRVSTQRYGVEWDGRHRIFSAPHEDYLSRTNPRGGPPTTEGVAYQLPLGDFTPGRWGWMLTDPRPCDPVPVTGQQGVFALPDDVWPTR